MKKVNKNSPALRRVFAPRIALTLPPYDCNAQILCIRHLDRKSNNSRILQNNTKEREEHITKEQTRSLLRSFVKRICSLRHQLPRFFPSVNQQVTCTRPNITYASIFLQPRSNPPRAFVPFPRWNLHFKDHQNNFSKVKNILPPLSIKGYI
jgi:hypothetical protein